MNMARGLWRNVIYTPEQKLRLKENLRRIQETSGMSAKTIAKDLQKMTGTSSPAYATVCHWFSPKSKETPGPDHIKMIADVFGCEPEAIYMMQFTESQKDIEFYDYDDLKRALDGKPVYVMFWGQDEGAWYLVDSDNKQLISVKNGTLKFKDVEKLGYVLQNREQIRENVSLEDAKAAARVRIVVRSSEGKVQKYYNRWYSYKASVGLFINEEGITFSEEFYGTRFLGMEAEMAPIVSETEG